jgi:hypothetical protein
MPIGQAYLRWLRFNGLFCHTQILQPSGPFCARSWLHFDNFARSLTRSLYSLV